MPDEPKPPTPVDSVTPPTNPAATPAPGDSSPMPSNTNAPSAPAKPADPDQTPPLDPTPTMDAAALADGTKPTILKPGETHRPTAKNPATLGRVYRRADILTTLITLAGVAIAGAIVVGVYMYFTRPKTDTTTAPKVTTLDKAELEKLGAFFEGNSAGTDSQVLTISSSSLFKNRVAISSDLKITGGLQVTGGTALADLTVDKTSTLGVTNVRGALTVAGPINAQSPALFGGGASITGNLAVSGNGTYAGSLAAGTVNTRDLSVSGTLSLGGRLSITGQNPSATPAAGAGTGASASVDGNDAGGTVTVSTGTVTHNNPDIGGLLVTVNFRSAYPRTPKVVITPIGSGAARLAPYVIKTATSFTIGMGYEATLASRTSYSFDYWVVQ